MPTTTGLAPRPHVVAAVRRETHDTVTLDVATDGDAPFAPGQFDMLYAPGVGEAPISISSDPSATATRSYTIREVGWVTRALVRLQPGAMLGVRGPYGRPWPLDEAAGRDLVLVAGGIGLAPLRPAVTTVLRERDRFRGVVLVVGARRPQDLVLADDLAAWEADPAIDVVVTVDSADTGWFGHVGVVTKLLPDADVDPDGTVVLACGPEVMMRFAARAMLERGVAADRIHVTLERSMRCGVGTCGHCQLGPHLVCRDGAVLAWPEVAGLLDVDEL